MKIKIASRFRPYSHKPGAACLIPGQDKIIQVWPSLSQVKTIGGEVVEERAGQKTLFQDLDRPYLPERLSFGNHKSQDFDRIRERKDLKEILPLWFKLGTFYRDRDDLKNQEVMPGSLLHRLVTETDRNKLPELFLQTYLAGFDAYFVPRNVDSDRQGFNLPPLTTESPLLLLTKGAEAIKKMLIQELDGMIHILPCLPSMFSAGRIVETPVAGGSLSIEWTKHFLRRVIFTSDHEDQEVNIRFSKDVKQYRVNASGKSFVFDNFKA